MTLFGRPFPGGTRRGVRNREAASHGPNLGNLGRARGSPSEADVQQPKVYIFLSPHFDDAVLSCGGLIHLLLGAGETVRVVTVFGGGPERPLETVLPAQVSWTQNVADPMAERANEDRAALALLGGPVVEHWRVPDAIYRSNQHGQPLYACWEEVFGDIACDDPAEPVLREIERLLSGTPGGTLFAPLSLGRHVDHQLLFRLGLRLRAHDHDVHFYEDWPYLEAYRRRAASAPWSHWRADIDIDAKTRATAAYVSQLPWLAGSALAVAQRLLRSARRLGRGRAQEGYWTVSSEAARQYAQAHRDLHLPFDRGQRPIRRRNRLLRALNRHNVEAILPRGAGVCLELDAQDERHRAVVESRGYRWQAASDVPRDGAPTCCYQLTAPTHSVAAVVTWACRGLSSQPEAVIAEVARVLMPGGVFCADAVPLPPDRGQRHAPDNEGLAHTLYRHGFRDVEIRPSSPQSLISTNTGLRALLPRPFGPGCALAASAAWLSLLHLRALRRRAAIRHDRFSEASGRQEPQPLQRVVFLARRAARSA